MLPCGQRDGMHSWGCCREGLVHGLKPLVGAEQTAPKAQAALHTPDICGEKKITKKTLIPAVFRDWETFFPQTASLLTNRISEELK